MLDAGALLSLPDLAFNGYVAAMLWVLHRDLSRIASMGERHDRELNKVFNFLKLKREKVA